MKITYTEIFESLQGEGLHQGVPSVFLRLFGCNFRCPGFNRHKTEASKPNEEVKQVIQDRDNYKEFKDLPLVSTGCDSYAAVYPEFKKFNKTVEIEELAKILNDMHEGKPWLHLVITGGEPLLAGQQKKLAHLIEMINYDEITFETNGTQKIIGELYDALRFKQVTVSASVKLSNSGESISDRINYDALDDLNSIANEFFFKFVVSDDQDIVEVKDILDNYGNALTYLMPVGGTEGPYKDNAKWVANQCIQNGWRYSPRLQIDLWKNSWGT